MEETAHPIREMVAEDYDEVAELWRITEGVGLDEGTDSREGVARYLQQNPGLSFVAREGGQFAGAVLCGHDGRRGYLHHLAVARSKRHQGIGQALVERCLATLGSLGIPKCNILVFAANESGERFWKHSGWKERADLKILQKGTPGSPEHSFEVEEDHAKQAGDSALAAAVVREATSCLQGAVATIRHCVDQMSDEQVWWRPDPSMNAVGNLILHLCGNVRQWIVSGIGGEPDVRERPLEFSERRIVPKAVLLDRLDEVVAAATRVLVAVTREDLQRTRRIQGFEVTGLGAILDSFPHFKGHTQEIVCLTRMQLEERYKFAWVPETAEQGAPSPSGV